MAPSVEVKTPPSPGSKRQRSVDDNRTYLVSGPPGINRTSSRDPSPAMRVKIPAFLNKSRSDISSSFQDLDWNQRFRLQEALTNPESKFRLDRSPIVISRNRYASVQPWDSVRVRLKSPIGGSDYINASPILLKAAVSPNLSPGANSFFPLSQVQTTPPEQALEKNGDVEVRLRETKYIATQGPKDGQSVHFWQMVMQETVGDVGVIVMLTTCIEGNKEKCSQYFPPSMDQPIMQLSMNGASEDRKRAYNGNPFRKSLYNDADADSDDTDNDELSPDADRTGTASDESSEQVTLLSLTHDTSTGCEVREMRLDLGGQSKTIYHYLFSNWPDFGKPEAEDRKALLELVKQSAYRAGRPDNPRFVHCSAGVGRTGTFIALDHLLQELESGNILANSVNAEAVSKNAKLSSWGRSGPARESTPDTKEDIVHETVDKLREQRMMMVMNELQFCFLYEALKEAFIDKYSMKSGQHVTDETTPKVSSVDKPSLAVKVLTSAGDDAEDAHSEAETEVMDPEAGQETDPYEAVAPESIMRAQERSP